MFDILSLFGAFGIILLLASFWLNHTKRIVRSTYLYNGLNVVGAGILTVYAYLINAQVFLVLEAIWVIVAAYYIIKKALKRGKK